MSFCPGTGGAECFGQGVFDLNNDHVFDSLDEANNEIVAGLRFEEGVPTDAAFIQNDRVSQLSNQDLDVIGTNTNSGSHTGRLSWKMLDSID